MRYKMQTQVLTDCFIQYLFFSKVVYKFEKERVIIFSESIDQTMSAEKVWVPMQALKGDDEYEIYDSTEMRKPKFEVVLSYKYHQYLTTLFLFSSFIEMKFSHDMPAFFEASDEYLDYNVKCAIAPRVTEEDSFY